MGQVLLPYTPQLDSELLEKQGLELADDAVQLVRFRQHGLALSRAKLATQLAPTQYQPWFILGTLYLQTKEIDQAIEVLRKALSIAPEEAGIKFTLGSAYFQQGKYLAAVTELEQGLMIKPDTPEALFDLGNSYLKLSKMTDAIALYRKTIAQDEKFWPAINNIGLIEYEQGNINSAIEKWQAASTIAPEEVGEPKFALAVALYAQGKIEKGLKLGEAVLKLDRSYSELQYLEDNLWGSKLLEDTKIFLATSRIRAVLESLYETSL